MWDSLKDVSQAAAAVPAGAEGDLLVDVLGVGHPGVVGGDEMRDVDEVARLGGLSGSVLGVRHGPHHAPSSASTASAVTVASPERGPGRGPRPGSGGSDNAPRHCLSYIAG